MDFFFNALRIRGRESDIKMMASQFFLISDRKKMGNASYLSRRWEMDEKRLFDTMQYVRKRRFLNHCTQR